MEESKILDTSLLINGERGLTTIFNIIEFPKALPNSKVLFPEKRDFILSLFLMTKLLKIGKPIQAIDVLVAAMALNRDIALATADKRISFLKSIAPGLKLEVK